MTGFLVDPYRFAVAESVGGWKELGRHTLGATSSSMSVSSLDDKRYYMILCENGRSGTLNTTWRLNNDSASNYSNRFTINGGTDSTNTSQTAMTGDAGGSSTKRNFHLGYLSNYSSEEKLLLNFSVQDNGAATNAPERIETVGKWANTSSVINRIDAIASASTYSADSELVILAYDPDDTETGGFFEELASVELGSAANEMDTGTIEAKKYLWIQVYIKGTGAAAANDCLLRFNDDSGSNYADRIEANGGTDATSTSRSDIQLVNDRTTAFTGGRYAYAFVVNNASTRKMVTSMHTRVTSGAGNINWRSELTAKWTNTSDQITDINVRSGGAASNYPAGSWLKVWGGN